METVFTIDDLVDKILSSDIIDCTTYRNIRLTCHKWNILAGTDRIDKYSNHFATLIEKYPLIDWQSRDVSRNKNLPLSMIFKYGKKCGSCGYMHDVLFNKNVTWNLVEKLGYTYDFVFINYAEQPFVTWEIIMLYPYANWDWDRISHNPNITMEIITNNPQYNWNYRYVSNNPNLTWDFIQLNLNMNWNWNLLSKHKCITWDIILLNFNLPWTASVALNPNITWDIIMTNLDKFQLNDNWDYISRHPNINLNDVIKYKDKFTWECLSKNPSIQWDFIIAHPELPWEWRYVSENPNITIKIIKANPQYPWSWYHLSNNPSLTWRELVNNEDIFSKLNVEKLVTNPFKVM